MPKGWHKINQQWVKDKEPSETPEIETLSDISNPKISVGFDRADDGAAHRTQAQEDALRDHRRKNQEISEKSFEEESRFDAPAIVSKVQTIGKDCTGWQSCSCGLEALCEDCKPDCRRCRCEVHEMDYFTWFRFTREEINKRRSEGFDFVPKEIIIHRIFDEINGCFMSGDTCLMFQPRSLYEQRKRKQFEENLYKHDDRYREERMQAGVGSFPQSAMTGLHLKNENDPAGSQASMTKRIEDRLRR